MVKTPEEYLADQDFLLDPGESGEDLTQAEKVFLEKYLGMEEEDILDKLGIGAPVEPERVEIPEAVVEPEPAEPVEQVVHEAAEVPEPEIAEPEAAEPEVEAATPEAAVLEEAQDEAQELPEAEALPEDEFEAELRQLAELQLVSFSVGGQEFTVPIGAVQEVVRAVPATKLPETPDYFAGIVNLRGRVTPLVRLKVLLRRVKPGVSSEDLSADDEKFIVVCRRKGLQVGLLVETMGTMYRVGQDNIEWNIEGRMGGTAEFVKALMRSGEDLVGILSVDSFVDKLIRK